MRRKNFSSILREINVEHYLTFSCTSDIIGIIKLLHGVLFMSNGLIKIIAVVLGIGSLGGASYLAKKKMDTTKFDEQIDKELGIQTKKEYRNSQKKK